MSFRVDYHVHLERGPYTSKWRDAFLATAGGQGLQELGFSEHLCDYYEGQAASGQWWQDDPHTADREHAQAWWRGRPRCHLDEYITFVQQTRPQNLALRLGIEVDYFSSAEESLGHLLAAYPFDYVIGSVHWLGAWGFDHLDRVHTWQGRNVDEVYRRYFALLVQAAHSGLFDVMAHVDVIKLAGHRPSFDLVPLYTEAARAFAEAGVAVEISTAGLRRPVGELYPSEPFLRLCKECGVPITLASDAHRPEDVGRDLDMAVALARRCGYTHVCRFAQREREEIVL